MHRNALESPLQGVHLRTTWAMIVSPYATVIGETHFLGLPDDSMIPLAREGLKELALGTLVLGACGTAAAFLYWPVAIPFAILWVWLVSFFRDPSRHRAHDPTDLCAPADGTITEIRELREHPEIEGPAIRIGMFLSLFNVHINRAPCSGRVRTVTYRPGEFLDARHPESGARNESNTLLIDPDAPLPGPVFVRQVAGLVARRIICHAGEGDHVTIGARIGLIKFGSRTELIIPRRAGTEINVKIGDKVHAGLTVLARQQRTQGAPAAPPEPPAQAASVST